MNHYVERMLIALLLLAFGPYVPLSRANDDSIDLIELEERAMQAAVLKVAPSVVRIETFGGLERVGKVLIGDGPTTGLVVSEDGYVISSAFNFVQEPDAILVTVGDGQRASAEIVARDRSRMLVLLKVNTEVKLIMPTVSPREELVVGQWTLAVGRTLDVKNPNTSTGILSAKNRIWGKAVQTDAKVSPSNYGGPLVDIYGRVIGVLVPMSPQATSELAGAEWYDSGIGFAVPLDQILLHLDQMKAGQDLHRGLLGISLKRGSIYSEPATVSASKIRSPADKAGIMAGDTIVEVAGKKIVTQAHLKHALGPYYGGDEVTIAIRRGTVRIEKKVTLAAQLLAYEHPFLGLLPRRNVDGILVRYVYPESGGSEAGLQIGDWIQLLDGKPYNDPESLRIEIARREIGTRVRLTVERDDKPVELEVLLGSLPMRIEDQLPAARDDVPLDGVRQVDVGVVDIKIPEAPNACVAVVPVDYNPLVAYGLVVYLPAPGEFDSDKFVERWKKLGEDSDLIVLSPQPKNEKQWTRTEVEFIRKTVDQAIATYNIDPTRVVVYGHQAGGAMAYLTGFQSRELFSGVVAVDAGLPMRMQLPDNDPVSRIAIYTTLMNSSRLAERVKQTIEKFREMKYPITVKDVASPRELDAGEIAELVRWIDALDRI
jgi:serine protease Do